MMNSKEDLCYEAKGCGLKHLTRMVYDILKREDKCSYNTICDEISIKSILTSKRRIYDCLNIMISLNLVVKQKKLYMLRIVQTNDLHKVIKQKKEELNRLNEIKEGLIKLVDRNECLKEDNQRLYMPFSIFSIEKHAKIYVETNEQRNFFKLTSDKNIELIDDVDIIRKLFKKTEDIEPFAPAEEKLKDFLNCLF